MQGKYVYNIGSITAGFTITISAPVGSTVILNITGTITNDVSFLITGGLTPNDVLYNVTTAPNVNTKGTITGILLAPNSTVTLRGGVITGQVIAKSLTMAVGTITFSGGPVIPEPSSLGVVAIGATALLGCRMIRRRRSSG